MFKHNSRAALLFLYTSIVFGLFHKNGLFQCLVITRKWTIQSILQWEDVPEYFCYLSVYKMPLLCGGTTEAKDANEEVQNICDEVGNITL